MAFRSPWGLWSGALDDGFVLDRQRADARPAGGIDRIAQGRRHRRKAAPAAAVAMPNSRRFIWRYGFMVGSRSNAVAAAGASAWAGEAAGIVMAATGSRCRAQAWRERSEFPPCACGRLHRLSVRGRSDVES